MENAVVISEDERILSDRDKQIDSRDYFEKSLRIAKTKSDRINNSLAEIV